MKFTVRVPGTFFIYMRTGVNSSATKLPVTITAAANTYLWKMPTGTTQFYRFGAIPVELSPTGAVLSYGPGLNEVLVRRKK